MSITFNNFYERFLTKNTKEEKNTKRKSEVFVRHLIVKLIYGLRTTTLDPLCDLCTFVLFV